MKWFKHMTDSLDDPFVQELLVEHGHQGYVAWFGLLEISAKQLRDPNTPQTFEFSPTFLKQKLHISPRKLQEIFEFCSRKLQLFFDFSPEKFKFQIPKLLDLKDNYTKDLQVTGNNVASYKDLRIKKKSKEPPIVPQGDVSSFDQFWIIYPRKVAKKAALKAWNKIKPELYPKIIAVISNGYEWSSDPQHIPHPATWLNGERWNDLQYPKPPNPYRTGQEADWSKGGPHEF